jgi:short-subunit dehydrogenase
MFTVSVSAFAHVPLEAAIAYVADFRNAPRWQLGLTDVEVDAPFPVAKSVVEVRRFLGRRIEAPGDLVDWIPGKGFTVRGHSGPLRVESRYGFAPEADGTRISLSLTMAATGLARVGEPILRRSITSELIKAFALLGKVLDSQLGDQPSDGSSPSAATGPQRSGTTRRTQAPLLRAGAATAGLAVGRMAIRAMHEQVDLRGKTALITGASRGLGLLIARELAASGCQVAICARTASDLDRAATDLRSRGATVVSMACDVSDEAQAKEFVAMASKELGPPDVLVNNAGMIRVGPLRSMTRADFDEALGVMFWGTVHTTLAALEDMRDRGSGNIVNIASISGKISVPHLLPQVCAKSAVVGFSCGLRSELAGDGIAVTTVLPGQLRTGSHLRAGYKGDAAREFTWFAVGSSLPLASMDAQRAARRIVAAMRRGRAMVVLPAPAVTGIVLNDLFPGAMSAMLTGVNRLLPRSSGTAGTASADSADGAAMREEMRSGFARWAAKRGEEAARQFNQLDGQ